MIRIANLFLQGENLGELRVQFLYRKVIVKELNTPVIDDKTYQILIVGK